MTKIISECDEHLSDLIVQESKAKEGQREVSFEELLLSKLASHVRGP
jgi:hypothetical protein